MLQKAALIANFYGKRGKLHPLIDRLIQGLDLSPQGQGSYVKEDNSTLLYSFDPPAAHDATIVQLALNAPGEVEHAWRSMRANLATLLADDTNLQDIWGYTLMYQAELAEGFFPPPAVDDVLPATQGLDASAPGHPQVLARTEVAGGWIWLVGLPLEGDGLKAATVYVALSRPDSHNRLVRDMLYNPNAALLVADLIAHKGYHQVRQYRLGDLLDRYRQQMDALRSRAGDVLLNLPEGRAVPGELDALGTRYSALVVAVADLHSLQVGLTRQVDNYTWWYKQAGEGEVVGYHQHFLEVALRELTLLVDEGQRPLEAAKMAVDMIGTSLEKEQERKQQRIETLLAAAAAILSVLTLFDKEAVRGLLEFLGVAQPISIFLILGIQLGLIVLITFVAILVIRLIGARHHE
jgi:hypothetical protein